MNYWKNELSDQVKKIYKDIKELEKIEKDVAYLSKPGTAPENHIETLRKAYFAAVQSQLLIIHSSIEQWLIDGAAIRKEA